MSGRVLEERVAPTERRESAAPELREVLASARAALLALQRADGHWCFELEADCTIPAETILWMHFTGEIDEALVRKLAVYLRRNQVLEDGGHGGWPLYHGGALDVSCTVKCYFALKLAGDAVDAPHMARARAAVLARGGAARSNVFTRIALATFGEVPWHAAPFVPVELILLPRWFPFHFSKVSYWTRTVTIPLSMLVSARARAKNPSGTTIGELFVTPPERERHWFGVRSGLNRALLYTERALRVFEPLIPGFVRRHAMRRATEWVLERRNGQDGLGAIFPAMVNAHEALRAELGPDDARVAECRAALLRLVVERDDEAYCQPCVSPVWDTGLACLALQEAERALGDGASTTRIERALEWLAALQVTDGKADWRDARPELPPGGWAFQYANAHYPDLDDTSVVAWALHQGDPPRWRDAIARAADWLRGMQSRNGGFAAFDADNTHYWLNEIPFADHGALLDPPTADVSARCATFFALLGRDADRAALARVVDYLLAEQEPCGAWFGRWGTNYVYGTWSALAALERVDDPRAQSAMQRAADWLEQVQRADGGWGESNDSYYDPPTPGQGESSTPFHTAWALLALCAAGRARGEAARRGVEHLLATRTEDGLWWHEAFNAPGFPRVFYLRYHGYARFFPVWALARCARELAGDGGA